MVWISGNGGDNTKEMSAPATIATQGFDGSLGGEPAGSQEGGGSGGRASASAPAPAENEGGGEDVIIELDSDVIWSW
eukprot:1323559-Rhodomonas_salina.4